MVQQTEAPRQKPERRFAVSTFWAERSKLVVGVFWVVDACEIQELRGSKLTVVATTAPEDADVMRLEWSAQCDYPDGRRARIEREAARFHQRLQEVRQCEG
jgi:hypothetical protein